MKRTCCKGVISLASSVLHFSGGIWLYYYWGDTVYRGNVHFACFVYESLRTGGRNVVIGLTSYEGNTDILAMARAPPLTLIFFVW